MKLNLIFICFFFSCQTYHNYTPVVHGGYVESNDTKFNKNHWEFYDVEFDSIPGLSLIRAQKLLKLQKNKEPIVVSIIDTEIDFNNTISKDKLWKNENEIPNNSIDDDKNGYIDDINGWNFLGNNSGENIIHQNYEYVRIVRYYDDNPDMLEVVNDSINIKKYQKAKKKLAYELEKANAEKEGLHKIIKNYKKCQDTLNPFFGEKALTIKRLDSFKTINDTLSKYVDFIYKWQKRGFDLESLNSSLRFTVDNLEMYSNMDFNERSLFNDDPNKINETTHGNNKLFSNLKDFYHGTQVAQVFANITSSNNTIKIQPIPIAANGDEHDKDISLAIRYAVDNDAKIINYSSGKDFSLHPKWILDALKYAEDNDVLVIVSAGNAKENIDDPNSKSYPEDFNMVNKEIISNLIVVGASSIHLNEHLSTAFSNYGKRNVDLFAPGENIETHNPNNVEITNSGTSLATPMVSGIAALIRSHYPSLTASEVKKILMDSSVKYDLLVDLPTKENPDQQVPFSSLSKSGGIVNAYNALLLAEEVANKK